MQPYYTDGDGITIYHGDCREILPTLPKVDLVLTDPPYGIGYVHGAEKSPHASKWNETPIVGDDKPFDPSWLLSIGSARILWGANHFAQQLPATPGWLVWDKRCGTGINDQSDCEIAWTDLSGTARMYYHLWSGYCKASERGVPRQHPTQKPIPVMMWCFGFASPQKYVVTADPFMGSGTTLVAAKRLGRCAIGIEIEEKYCEIAARRVEAERLTLFEHIEEKTGDLFHRMNDAEMAVLGEQDQCKELALKEQM